MNSTDLDTQSKHNKELTDDILDKLKKGYRLAPNPQGKTASMDQNNAETTIEKPFEDAEDMPLVLTADNIISRTEKDGETVAYEVIHDSKLMFSTVSRPLAQSFLIGWNAGQQKKSASKSAGASATSVDPADISAAKSDSDKPPAKDAPVNSAPPRKRMLF